MVQSSAKGKTSLVDSGAGRRYQQEDSTFGASHYVAGVSLKEAFQDAAAATATGTATTAAGTAVAAIPAANPTVTPQCPSNALSSFPVTLKTSPTLTLYESRLEPVVMQFQWATRSSGPKIIDIGDQTTSFDEGETAGLTATTLRYNSSDYILTKVQLRASSHSSWVTASNAATTNTHDIIVHFTNRAAETRSRYVVFVIPLVRTLTMGKEPPYLKGFLEPGTNASYSIQSLFPSDATSLWALYSTCIPPTSTDPTLKDALVCVAVEGVSVTGDFLQKVVDKAGGGGANTLYTGYAPFFGSISAKQIDTIGADFNSFVRTTRTLMNFNQLKTLYKDLSKAVQEVDSGSYKCVNIDPDTAVDETGVMTVDMDSGQVLTNILKEREALREAAGTTVSTESSRLNKYFSSALGIFTAAVGLGALIYLLYSFVLSPGRPAAAPATGPAASTAATAAAAAPSIFSKVSTYTTLFGFLCLFFIGFIIGTVIT